MRPLRPLARIRPGAAAALIFAWLAAVSIPAPRASASGVEGEPGFGISGYFKTPPRLDEPSTLLVRVWGEDTYDRPITSVARISVPEGIEVLSGDTVSVALVSRYTRRHAERLIRLVIRPVRIGSYVIRGWLGIDGGEEHGSDETDFLLPLSVQPDTVIYARAPHPTRFENVRHGQRYRYAGRYLVPIDSTQALLQEEITEKAKTKTQEPAGCPGCPGPLPAVVPFVVMVGSDGRVRESRLLDVEYAVTVDPALVAAAAEALARWEFVPALAGDRPVADYVVVRVPVRDGQP
jgi:hypothetical protein